MAIITADDLKTFLTITSEQHDITAAWATEAAIQWVGQWCGRSFDDSGAVSERLFTPLTDYAVDLDDFHTTTGLIVKTDINDDGTFETTWTGSDYQIEPLNQMVDGVAVPYSRLRAVNALTFPTPTYRPTVAITARWGWATVPPVVRYATLLKASRLFFRRESPQGVAGFDQFGAVRLSGNEDPDVVSLLAPFRRIPYAALVY